MLRVISNKMKPERGLKKIQYLFKETFTGFINDNVLKLSAALSYYTIFSLPPLAIIATSFCGIYYGKKAINGDLYKQIGGFVGNKAALQIQELIKNVNLSAHNAFAAIIGIIILLLVASGMFSEIQDSIDYIWGIKTKPKHGVRRFLINHATSFIMIACSGVLLLISMVTTSIMDILYKGLVISYSPETIGLYYLLNSVVLFLLATFFLMVIFKTLPDGKIGFRDCFIGASFTAIFFTIGKFLIGAYFSRLSMNSVYSTAGSVIIILAWVYYSAIILYFGAEFTKVYSNTYGKKIIANKYTTLIIKTEENL
jgi:membrane protein